MKILILLSVLTYVVACCLPALQWKNNDKSFEIMLGLRALAVGWSGIFAGIVAWFANPLWVAALCLQRSSEKRGRVRLWERLH